MKSASWQDVLTAPAPGQHIVQTYQDERFLVEAVGQFAAAGLAQGQGVVLIATKSHLKAFHESLEKWGYDLQNAQKASQFMELAVEDVLPQVMVNTMPVAHEFNRLAEAAIHQTRGRTISSGIRIYGELVNVLWLAGNLKGAMAIEALWHELGKTHPFTLFCGYKMDNFDQNVSSGALQSVCEAHSHLIPAENYEHLEEAVLMGSRDILGDSLALMVRDFAATAHVTAVEMPVAQKTLLWLHKNMPVIADKISSRTRNYYQQFSRAAQA